MANPLVRYQSAGDTHFVTFSCYRRQPHLGVRSAYSLFESSLEKMRLRYDFHVFGYAVVPEHVHLLVTEPKKCLLSKAIQALKLSVAVQRSERPFWQSRYYDFNVFTTRKHTEKLRYIHRNPGTRGLVEKKEDWPWASLVKFGQVFDTTSPGRSGRSRSNRGGRVREGVSQPKPTSQKRDVGHPIGRWARNETWATRLACLRER